MNWTLRRNLIDQLQRRWDRGQLLASLLDDEPLFPLRLKLKTPTSGELSAQFDLVRQWINDLQQAQPIRIEYKTIRHRILGQNDIPQSAWIDSLHDACRLLHKLPELEQFQQLLQTTRQRHPQLLPWIKRYPLRALQQAAEWPQLLDVIDWFTDNLRAGIYLRQIDLPGIDSKFIERHRALLMPLLDLSLPNSAIDASASGLRHFARRYGLRDKPLRIRFRLLDPSQPLISGPEQDITLTQTDFAALNAAGWVDRHIKQIFITENEINFLAFPAQTGSLLLFGAGYGFASWREIDWLVQHPSIAYWGDIDTHGFAILDQLRATLPQAQSLLMDQQTLLEHRKFWGREDKPEQRNLPRLNKMEHALYRNLVENRLGQNIRLEQERIRFSVLTQTLSHW